MTLTCDFLAFSNCMLIFAQVNNLEKSPKYGKSLKSSIFGRTQHSFWHSFCKFLQVNMQCATLCVCRGRLCCRQAATTPPGRPWRGSCQGTGSLAGATSTYPQLNACCFGYLTLHDIMLLYWNRPHLTQHVWSKLLLRVRFKACQRSSVDMLWRRDMLASYESFSQQERRHKSVPREVVLERARPPRTAVQEDVRLFRRIKPGAGLGWTGTE